MGFFSSVPKKTLPWIQLTSEDQLNYALEGSKNKPTLFFKHSTRCSISSMALSRFQEKWSTENELCELYFLDLLAYRQISNKLEEKSNVIHQSPQVIITSNGTVIYSASHSEIDAHEIEKILQLIK